MSAHPTYIRNNYDFRRNSWMTRIQEVINSKGVAILKGVSGQGKSSLCYRYLIDTYPEGCVFCVRSITNEGQAQNLVTALDGLGKHNSNLIIYIDVQPGETLWAFLLQELQARGLSIPVLISIRDEDYNLTPISGKAIQYGIVELTLSREEAEHIYNSFTEIQPHTEHRTFEEAWQSFGGQGPLIEFVYLLTNNKTLTQRLQEQLDVLLQEGISDEWLELLQLVCYAGRLGCAVNLTAVKNEIHCSTMNAAIRRLKDTLFWLAKRGLNITLPFKNDEIVASVCAGGLQPSADAIRGLFEHPALMESYLAAVDVLVEKLIYEMRVLTFSVTSDEVSCKFIPPMTETSVPENTKNTNQYWRIKMLDILKQLYPEKEYINIELIGVNLFQDLGIEALDYKLHIHKSKRPNAWVFELNGWIKIRIDYSLRPSSWQKYVDNVDEIRTNVNDLVVETIRLIDDVYRKGRYTQDRGKRIDDRLKVFRKYIFIENYLPYSAVDPYCLYSEGNDKSPVAEYFPMRQLLSVDKYKKFRKYLNDVCFSLDNFYNQFIEVLRVRVQKQDISIVENPRLAMYNLYSAAKALADFQKEYDLLFSDYSSLNEDFAKQELENVLTLVNVWRYVLDNQPKGYAIAYDAKQKYCKGTKYFYDTLSKAVMAVGGTLLKGNKYAYIIVEYNMEEDNDFKNEYTKIVMAIREVFKNSVLPSSDRWYLETQSLELAYVPVFSGVFSPIVYSIPFYKLLDTEESNIAKTMYPCEIEPILSEKINATEILQLWVDAMKKIGEIKLYLKRYQQIIQVPVDEKCLCSMTSYIKLLMEQINVLWEEFLLLEDTVSVMIEDADEQSSKQLNFVQHFFDCYEKIEAVISSKNDSTELIQVIEMVYIVMFALLPFVSKYDLQHKNI